MIFRACYVTFNHATIKYNCNVYVGQLYDYRYCSSGLFGHYRPVELTRFAASESWKVKLHRRRKIYIYIFGIDFYSKISLFYFYPMDFNFLNKRYFCVFSNIFLKFGYIYIYIYRGNYIWKKNF